MKKLLLYFFVICISAEVYASDALRSGEETSLYNEAQCLALNMYHEARNQGTVGVVAVSSVVLNRVSDSRFPNTICEVVLDGPTRPSWKGTGEEFPVRHRCQFSWYCDGKSDTPKDSEIYERYILLASNILDNILYFIDVTDGATFYHADYVTPAWSKTKTKTVEIEDHIFYKWEIN
tara:strand:- start:486 stop:1016 length:531 start_codon:yes stop_codon:yes gene_type:complete